MEATCSGKSHVPADCCPDFNLSRQTFHPSQCAQAMIKMQIYRCSPLQDESMRSCGVKSQRQPLIHPVRFLYEATIISQVTLNRFYKSSMQARRPSMCLDSRRRTSAGSPPFIRPGTILARSQGPLHQEPYAGLRKSSSHQLPRDYSTDAPRSWCNIQTSFRRWLWGRDGCLGSDRENGR